MVARSRRILLRGDLLRKTDRCQVGQVVAAVLNIVRGVLNIIKVVTAALNIVKRASKEMRDFGKTDYHHQHVDIICTMIL